MGKMMPSSGDAVANVPYDPNDYGGSACTVSVPNSVGGRVPDPDMDCDGLADWVDPCPTDPANACIDREKARESFCESADRFFSLATLVTIVGAALTLGRKERWQWLGLANDWQP